VDPSALAELDRAWRSDGEGSFASLVERGAAALRAGDLTTAQSALLQAEALNADDHQVQNLLGLVLYKGGMLDLAEARFGALLARFPDEITLLMNHAMVQLKRGQYASARQDLARLLQLNPEHKRAAGYLGLCCEQLGDLAAAARAYQQAGNFPAAEHVLRRHADQIAAGASPASTPRRVEPPAVPPPAPTPAAPPSSPRAREPAAIALPVRAVATEVPPTPDRPVVAAAPHPTAPVDTREVSPPPPAEVAVAAPAPGLDSDGRRDVIDLGDVEPLEPSARVTLLDGLVLLRLEGEAMLRADRWVGRFGDLDSEVALRRSRGTETDQPLGGAHPLIAVRGIGTALLRVDEAMAVTATLDGELFVVEPRLLALIGGCRHETARLVMPDGAALSLLRLRGQGQVVLCADRRPARLRIVLGTPVVVLASSLLAFMGKVLPRVAPAGPRSASSPPMLHLLGEGEVWVDGGSLLPFEVTPSA
jgi:hypothetical protein